MEVPLRHILFCVLVSLSAFAADARTVGQCDLENQSFRDSGCWEAFDILDEMADIAFNLHEAECRDIMEAIQTTKADLSAHQQMLIIAFQTYSNAYAAASPLPDDFVLVELLTFCRDNPGAQVQDFRLPN